MAYKMVSGWTSDPATIQVPKFSEALFDKYKEEKKKIEKKENTNAVKDKPEEMKRIWAAFYKQWEYLSPAFKIMEDAQPTQGFIQKCLLKTNIARTELNSDPLNKIKLKKYYDAVADYATQKNYYVQQTEEYRIKFFKCLEKKQTEKKFPAHHSLRNFCTPVDNQFDYGTCATFALVGALEFYLKQRAILEYDDHRYDNLLLSKLFPFQVGCKTVNDISQGIYPAKVVEILSNFGTVPTIYWNYAYTQHFPWVFNIEPSAFVYAFAREYKVKKAFRIDLSLNDDIVNKESTSGGYGNKYISSIKQIMSANGETQNQRPVMIGIWFYFEAETDYGTFYNGEIPLPKSSDGYACNSHSILLVGWDDNKVISPYGYAPTSPGAFLFKNSWGTGWGDRGYGWLPYDYLKYKLATCGWVIDTADFCYPDIRDAVVKGVNQNPIMM